MADGKHRPRRVWDACESAYLVQKWSVETAARLFARAGHEVAVSNSREPASLTALIEEIGPRARADTIEGAGRFGDVVLVVPWREPGALPDAQVLAGKIVVHAMNPVKAGGGIYDLGMRAVARRPEEVQAISLARGVTGSS